MGLRVEPLDSEGVRAAVEYRRGALPFPYCFMLAKISDWTLLAGDDCAMSRPL